MKDRAKAEAFWLRMEVSYLRSLSAQAPLYPWILGFSLVLLAVTMVLVVSDLFDRDPNIASSPFSWAFFIFMFTALYSWSQMQTVRILRRHGILPPRKP